MKTEQKECSGTESATKSATGEIDAHVSRAVEKRKARHLSAAGASSKRRVTVTAASAAGTPFPASSAQSSTESHQDRCLNPL